MFTLGHFLVCCVGCDLRSFGDLESLDGSAYFCLGGTASRRQASLLYCSTVSSGLSSRGKRAISNTTPSQKSDIEKRLKAVEER